MTGKPGPTAAPREGTQLVEVCLSDRFRGAPLSLRPKSSKGHQPGGHGDSESRLSRERPLERAAMSKEGRAYSC